MPEGVKEEDLPLEGARLIDPIVIKDVLFERHDSVTLWVVEGDEGEEAMRAIKVELSATKERQIETRDDRGYKSSVPDGVMRVTVKAEKREFEMNVRDIIRDGLGDWFERGTLVSVDPETGKVADTKTIKTEGLEPAVFVAEVPVEAIGCRVIHTTFYPAIPDPITHPANELPPLRGGLSTANTPYGRLPVDVNVIGRGYQSSSVDRRPKRVGIRRAGVLASSAKEVGEEGTRLHQCDFEVLGLTSKQEEILFGLSRADDRILDLRTGSELARMREQSEKNRVPIAA